MKLIPRLMAAVRLRPALCRIGLVVLMLTGPLPRVLEAGPADRPNIVLILADDLGYGDVGFMGQPWIRTPELDRLAAEGIIFTRHYAGGAACTPSRCSLMTGMHNGHNVLHMNAAGPVGYTLRAGDVTLGEVLQAAGYQTHFVGKWGLGGALVGEPFLGSEQLDPEATIGLPTRQGFHTSLAFLDQVHAHVYFPRYLWEGDQIRPLAGNWRVEDYGRRTHYVHDTFTGRAMEIIDAARPDQPFYLQLSYTIPHRETKFPRSPHDADEAGPEAWNPYTDEDFAGMDPAPEPVSEAYAAMIAYMDRDIGRIIAAIRGHEAIATNTLVIFTSDNGPQFTDGHEVEVFDSNGPLRGAKFSLYEGGIRVPFAAWWPGRIEPGQTSDHPAYFPDMMPTLAELAGAPVPRAIDGLSFANALLGRGGSPEHDFMVWRNDDAVFLQNPRAAIRARTDAQGRAWKLLRTHDGGHELYDLNADPGETNNLAAQHPDVVEHLRGVMDSELTGPLPVAAFRLWR